MNRHDRDGGIKFPELWSVAADCIFEWVGMQNNSGSLLVGEGASLYLPTLGLCKKQQLWKLKAGRVVSHAFEYAEFDGARKIDFKHF